MLSEMHDKLSHAVRLYDQLLTNQIAHPTWRAASTSHQPYNHVASQYHTVDGSTRSELGEWSQQESLGSPELVNQGYQTIGHHPDLSPPPVQNHSPPQHQPLYQQYAPNASLPIQHIPSPPAQQQQSYRQAALPSTLSRHSTLSHSTYAPSAIPSSSTTLGRSNTIASYSQPQQVYAPPPDRSLPAFPTAPTSNPQLYPLYSPPTTGFEETKKEVTLIDL